MLINSYCHRCSSLAYLHKPVIYIYISYLPEESFRLYWTLKMDFSMSAASSAAGGASGDEQEPSNTSRGKKSYHRHTARQIQQLESCNTILFFCI